MNTNQQWILTPGITRALTYQIYEDNAGGLHMLIYQEDLKSAVLVEACLNILPEDIKGCIEGLDEWTCWEGLAGVMENEAGITQIRDLCTRVEETRIESLGLVRVTCYNAMGEAAKQAFKFRSSDDFGGRYEEPTYEEPTYEEPTYEEPTLKDYVSGCVRAKRSELYKTYDCSGPVPRVKFRGDLLYVYMTAIAVINRKARVLVIRGQRYSQTISRIQNVVENLASREGFDIYYLAPSVPLDKVFV